MAVLRLILSFYVVFYAAQIVLQYFVQRAPLSDSLQPLLGAAGPGPEDAALSPVLRLPHYQTGRPSHRHQAGSHLPATRGELSDRAGQSGSVVHIQYVHPLP